MRPRQICRGIAARGHSTGTRVASMRPRQICRGIAITEPARADRCRRFNEAPADLPGNYAITCDSSRPRFNEAPADQPGKFAVQLSAAERLQ